MGMSRSIKAQHEAYRDDIGDLVTRRPVPGPGVEQVDPFLFLNHHGPQTYPPNNRGLPFGPHPHRGFETVTFILEGELGHYDSGGHASVIRAGGVQWMTAGSGLIHAELSPPEFKARGGPMEILQLWVNLPAKDKMAPARYQAITSADIPVVELPDGTGKARVIAGELLGTKGPARTFTPVNVWDLRLNRGTDLSLEMPEGHTAMLVVLAGHVTVNGTQGAGEAEMVLLDRAGRSVTIHADGDATLLVLTGQPLSAAY